MRTALFLGLVTLSILYISSVTCTANEYDVFKRYLTHLPSDIQLKEDEPYKYIFTCDYFYLNTQGDVVRKQRVSGEYTRALPDGKVRWNNVRIAQALGFDDAFPEGERQDYMEGFTYHPSSYDMSKPASSEDMLKPEFFRDFPVDVVDTKNLVWDTAMFEIFGWSYLDKLKLNRTYYPSEPVGEIPLAGAGAFQNRRIELTWLGISEMNEEPCALIQYRAFFNKFSISTEPISVRGGSHYWGEIWVSLKDKQIEYATLYESVLTEVRLAGQQDWQIGSVLRRGTFQKSLDFGAVGFGEEATESIFQQEYDLAGERSAEPHFYHMESKVVFHAEDGTRTGVDMYKLRLMCEPGDISAGEADKYTCARFALQTGGGAEVTIPALEEWSYDFKMQSLREGGLNEQGQVFGIPHAKFEGLTDSNGGMLPQEVAYQVYNMFINFHSWCNGFAQPVRGGKGIQDLKRIGDKIIHEAAFSELPIDLGGQIAEGSTFKNGEITLEFKGLSVVDGASCAIVGFDSGESSFTMLIKPMPNIEVNTVGGSHYQGDIYVDLGSKWTKKVLMTLMDVTKTTMGGQKVASAVVETTLTIKAVEKEAFGKD